MKFEKKDELRELVNMSSKPFYIKRDRGSHYASDVGSCIRALYYKWIAEVPEREFDHNISEIGKAVELIIVEKCKRARMFVANGVRVRNDKLNISYEIDLVIADPTELKDGQPTVVPVEIKSCNHWAYITYYNYYCPHCHSYARYNSKTCKACNRDFKEPIKEPKENDDGTKKYGYNDQPSDHHYQQLMVYIMDNDFPYGYLVYYNKNTSEETWFKVLPDVQMWEDIKNKIRELEGYVTLGEPPERPFKAEWKEQDGEWALKDSSDWQCRYCDYAKLCWGKTDHQSKLSEGG